MAASAKRPDPVDEDQIKRIIEDEIRSGVTFENDAKGNQRSVALDYYDGIMRDLPAEEGRSKVVSRDVADVIDTMMPGLMRIFAGAGTLGVYQPAKRGDEDGAKQATEYVDYVLSNDCAGFQTISTWLKDGLQVRNGIVKVWWDDSVEYEVEDQRGLTADQVTMLFDDGLSYDDLLGARPSIQMVPDPTGGPALPVEVFDLRYRRAVTEGRLRIENVPPEDFGISAKARSIESAACVWHRTTMTKSDLLRQNYPKAKVDALPAFDGKTADEEDRNRERSGNDHGSNRTGAMQEVEVIEAYLYADRDGDGIAESLKVVLAGNGGGRHILSIDEWPDDRPFVDWTPQPVPHAWMGKSIADNVMDLMRVKTALQRGMLDNMYGQNRPQRAAVLSALENPDDLFDQRFGGVIRIKPGNDARAAIADMTVPNILPSALTAIQAVDSWSTRRTGISQATASLDDTALDPQTATAEQLEHDAAYARVELVARCFAELGVKRLYAKMLRILVRNQDRPRTIRLRDTWVDFDPRAWNATMDVTVNVGLGTGSRERDLAMLTRIYAMQVQVVERLGADNPIVKPSMIVATQHKMVEAAGIRNPDAFFADVSDEDFAQWQASKPPPDDPRKAEAEARIQVEQQKVAAQIQGTREKAAAEMQIKREGAEFDLQAERERLNQEYALKREEMERTMALRMQELENEARLREAAIVSGAHSVSTNLPRQ